jgi:multidrug transporter EmrE-like cation transporter
VAVLSAVIFKEKLTPKKVLGIGLIIAGIVIFNLA